MNAQAEVVTDMPSNAVALRPSMAVGHALGVDEIVAQVKLIQDVMHRVMKDGEHYGTIPGCGNKKTLLQPGAQKLTMTFRLAPEYEIQEVNLERGHKEYRVICTLKSMGNGSFVGQGVGCCSSMESKYRWRGGARKCPECGKETIIKGKAEYGGGWLCYQKKGGCGHKWPDGAQEIEGQNIERVENDNPADTFNTVLKMAKKRAFVDATITATAASDIFTQDMEEQIEEPQNIAPAEPPHPPPPPPKPKTRADATPEQKAKLIAVFEKEGATAVQAALGYFVDAGAILPTETLEALPLRWVPATQGEMRELGGLIAVWNIESKATRPSWLPPMERTPIEATKPIDATKPLILPDGMEEEVGELQQVTVKEGKSAKGPWVLYGLLVNDKWHNSFSNTIGKAAQGAKGQEVRVIYLQTPKGRTVHDLVIDGFSVENPPVTP